jgi:hypothetical protein
MKATLHSGTPEAIVGPPQDVTFSLGGQWAHTWEWAHAGKRSPRQGASMNNNIFDIRPGAYLETAVLKLLQHWLADASHAVALGGS